MSGPIVRTGTTPEFWKNWDRAFGKESSAAGEGQSPAKAAKKAAGKKAAAKKTAAKKSAGKKTSGGNK